VNPVPDQAQFLPEVVDLASAAATAGDCDAGGDCDGGCDGDAFG
jgi:hypothetical protein